MGISERKEREREEMEAVDHDSSIKDVSGRRLCKDFYPKYCRCHRIQSGTIYLYYKDKDELLFEVQRQAYNQLLEVFKTKAQSEDPFERLSQICRAYLDFGLENPELYDLMFIIRAPMNADESQHKSQRGRLLQVPGGYPGILHRERTHHIFGTLSWRHFRSGQWPHGLVSLDLRCRLKVMTFDPVTIRETLNQSIEEYLNCIRK